MATGGSPPHRVRNGHSFSSSPCDGSVADSVTAVPGKRQLVRESWRLRAERVEILNGNDWRALVGVRRGLKLLVTWSEQGQELHVEAWAGEPEETDGVAVIDIGGDIRLARFRCALRGPWLRQCQDPARQVAGRVTSCLHWWSCSEGFPGPRRLRPVPMFFRVAIWPP